MARSGLFTGVAEEINHCCYDVDGSTGAITQIADPANTYFSLAGGECRSCTRKLAIMYSACVTGFVSIHLDESVVNTVAYSCFENVAEGTCGSQDNFDNGIGDANMCCNGEFQMINYQLFSPFGGSTDPCLLCKSCISTRGTSLSINHIILTCRQ